MHIYKVGLVGFPNVGKSSLFSFLTNNKILIANYPFSTIKPNIGIFFLVDDRIEELQKIWKSNKITKSFITIVDIAGLVKKAHVGVGLGNEFLSAIRNVDLVCNVLRCFDDPNIFRYQEENNQDNISLLEDYENLSLELIMSDIQQINRSILKVKNNIKKLNFLNKLKYNLEQGNLYELNKNLDKEETDIVKEFSFLSLKPNFIVENGNDIDKDKKKNDFIVFKDKNKLKSVTLEVNKLLNNEIDNINRNNLIKFSNIIKDELKIKVFFTVGEDEIKSWIAQENYSAKECAGLIHCDLQKNFINVQVYSYNDWIECEKDIKLIKKRSKIRIEKSNYIIKDGDICLFVSGSKKK